MKKKIITIFSIIVILVGIGFGYFFGIAKPHKEAVNNFNSTYRPIEDKNKSLDKIIKNAEKNLANNELPLDNSTKTNLEKILKKSQNDKIKVPEIPNKTSDINKSIKSLPKKVDYSINERELKLALSNFKESINKNKLVTNPTSDFVIEKLKSLPTVTGVQAVTETNDPNGSLNKPGGYTSAIYFTDSAVQDQIDGSDIVAKGTDAGGQIEVYKSSEEAQKRNDYLSAFDGAGLFNSGSHEVCGTCVIRISSKLTATQQKELTKKIIDSLTQL
ncbi:EbhA [Lactococcus lactis]|uniref:EbhA n=1 Tax=Lactococcus lactis TaxID=1358 RepID=UPI0018D95BE7|nr:EbhA [Lactococcus lactis]MCT0027915.1 EbhA [Lactococcus lactis subsp. lactis]MCT3106973.1 EbhA [Lactococcus lactis]MCT3113810.1 EbhA [Lactococcus lactis]MDA2885375.1 EbhA [Lactococcus lactis]MDA2887910.1 EbhA [Lactococcus lactis]